MQIRTRGIALLALALLATTGCELGTGFDENEGRVAFAFDGAEEGLFSARGSRGDEWDRGTWGAGRISPTEVSVIARWEHRDGSVDFIWFSGRSGAPGTYPLKSWTQPDGVSSEFGRDVDHRSNSARVIYELVDGTFTLEGTSNGRIRGRFSGTAVARYGTETIQITDGVFDVPNNLPGPVE
jgi:hypothetical protein